MGLETNKTHPEWVLYRWNRMLRTQTLEWKCKYGRILSLRTLCLLKHGSMIDHMCVEFASLSHHIVMVKLKSFSRWMEINKRCEYSLYEHIHNIAVEFDRWPSTGAALCAKNALEFNDFSISHYSIVHQWCAICSVWNAISTIWNTAGIVYYISEVYVIYYLFHYIYFISNDVWE